MNYLSNYETMAYLWTTSRDS